MSTTYGKQVLLDLCVREPGDSADPVQRLEELLEGCKVTDDGVWVEPAPAGATAAERHSLEWHPRANREVPALPFEFAAGELAAFLWAGSGHSILEQFLVYASTKEESVQGHHFYALDDDTMAELGPNAGRAREALKAAYGIYCEAANRFRRDTDGSLAEGAKWILDQVPAGGVLPEQTQAGATSPEDVRDGGLTRHRIAPGRREDALAPLIRDIVAALANDGHEPEVPRVWATLCAMAEQASPPRPLIGIDRGEVSWRTGSDPEVAHLDRNALRGRLRRLGK